MRTTLGRPKALICGKHMPVDIDELKQKRICSDCVGEPFLKGLVAEGSPGECGYCGLAGPSYSLEELADCIERCFDQHFTRTYDDRFENNRGDPAVWVIGNVAEIEEQPAIDIQKILARAHAQYGSDYIGDPTPFDNESTYAEKGVNDWFWQHAWREFERSLKTESRYFSQAAAAHLASVFADIEEMNTAGGQPIIVAAGPGSDRTHFYRARAFESVSKLEVAMQRPDLHIGPPPSDLVLGGRMNARGISVFYGADSQETALAEVRPPVGSHVLVAKFDLTRPVRLLDLQALADIRLAGSLFDPTYIAKVERAKFLEYLLRRITMPVMPSDEGLQYLATQAVADFLASRETPALDGILYPSVQVAGASRNVVLFQKSSRVARMALPRGTRMKSSTGEMREEGWEADFVVIEEVLVPPEEAPRDQGGAEQLPSMHSFAMEPSDADTRAITLAIEPDCVEVRQVRAVSFDTSNHKVNRIRWEGRDDMPF